MNKEQITEFVKKNIRYKDWEFYVGDKNGAVYLQIKFDAPCHCDPSKIERQHCRKWLLSEWMTPTEIVQTVWAAVVRAEIHEAAETFMFKGKDIFNTHIDVEALVEACSNGAYEHRGDAKV